MEGESEKLWMHVSSAILSSDQNGATQEKFLLEEAQRQAARERKAKMEEWNPKLFERDPITGDWVYKYAELVYLCSFSSRKDRVVKLSRTISSKLDLKFM